VTVNFGGNIYDDAGNAVSGASVKLLETGTTTQEGSTVTSDSNGRWDFLEADQDRYDVEITKGSSVRRIKWSDEISLQEIDVRNNTGATTPAATFTNLTNNAANQVAVFSGANSTKADGDEIYLSFKLHDSAGNLDEFARMTVEATDVTTTTEDGQIRFGVIVGGTLTDVFTIDSSTGGAATISYEVDSFTIKGGEGEAGVLYLFADQGDNAGDEWKINVADGGVLTIGNDIASAGTYVTFLTLTPHATTASSTVAIVGDATVGDDLSLTSDSSVFNMGAGNDFTITHDGTTGATLAGNPITVNSTGALTLDSSTDITLDADGADVFLKDGGTLFGTLTNSSGELVIKSSSSGTTAATFSGANVTLAGTVGSGAITSTSTIQGTTITATTAFVPDASDGAALGTTSLEFSDLYLADGAVVGFGDDQEVTLTHVHNAGLLLSSTDKLQFGDSGTFIHQSADGVLTIESDTTVDINGTVAFDGALTGITNITLSGTLSDSNYTFDTSGNVSGLGTVASGAITSSGIIKTDDATEATSTTDGSLQTDGGLSVVKDAVFGDDVKLLSDSAVLAFGADGDATLTHTNDTGLKLNSTNKLMFNDASQFVQGSSATVISIGATDEIDLTATAVDLNGTLDVSGNAQLSGTVTAGADGAGLDVKFFGGTAAAYMLWDAAAAGSWPSANTAGLVLHQGADDGEILVLQSTDVGHPFSSDTGNDETFVVMKKASATSGGLILETYIDAGNANSFYLRGKATSVNTTKSTSAYAPIHLQGSVLDSNTAGTVSSNGNLATIDNLYAVKFIFDAEGDLHLDAGGGAGTASLAGTATDTNHATETLAGYNVYDDQADWQMARALHASLVPETDFGQEHKELVERFRPLLEDRGIVAYNDDGHHFIAMKRLALFQLDAMYQMGEAVMAMATTLQDAGMSLPENVNKLLALQGAV
jgi:hypothetical protein